MGIILLKININKVTIIYVFNLLLVRENLLLSPPSGVEPEFNGFFVSFESLPIPPLCAPFVEGDILFPSCDWSYCSNNGLNLKYVTRPEKTHKNPNQFRLWQGLWDVLGPTLANWTGTIILKKQLKIQKIPLGGRNWELDLRQQKAQIQHNMYKTWIKGK